MTEYAELQSSIILGQRDVATRLVNALIDEGKEPQEIINEGLTHGMAVVGGKFKTGEMFIPEVIASGDAMSACMELVKPLIAVEKLESGLGKVVIGTVSGDFHNIGKALVIIMMESAGFTMVDLGVDVPTDKFI